MAAAVQASEPQRQPRYQKVLRKLQAAQPIVDVDDGLGSNFCTPSVGRAGQAAPAAGVELLVTAIADDDDGGDLVGFPGASGLD